MASSLVLDMSAYGIRDVYILRAFSLGYRASREQLQHPRELQVPQKLS